MGKTIRLKQFAYDVHGIIPESCTMVVGVEWDEKNKKPPMFNSASKFKTLYLTDQKFSGKIELDTKSSTVMFCGSDWSLQIEELIKCIGIVHDLGKKVAFQVPCTFENFQFKLGVYVAKQQGDLYDQMKHMMDDVSDYEFFTMLGMAYLDNQLQYDYYVIAGLGQPKHYFIRKDDGDEIDE